MAKLSRLWAFPLVLTPASTLLPIICVAEAWACDIPWMIRNFDVGSFTPHPEVLTILLYSGLSGFAVSWVAAIKDDLKSHRWGDTGWEIAARLSSNLFWCLLYSMVLVVIDSVLSVKSAFLIEYSSNEIDSLFNRYHLNAFDIFRSQIPIEFSIVMNVIAALWGTFRTINTLDVLTPRVLLSKVRRSSQLEN